MKNFVLALTTLVSLSAFAAGPGDLQDSLAQRIQTGIEACGLKYVSGQDPSLSYQIRARNVDNVVVSVQNGVTVPGVLVDRNSDNDGLNLTYSQTNGGLIMNIHRDFNFNDLAIDTARHGRVAFTNSYFAGSNTNLVTRYYALSANGGQVETSQDSFVNFVNTVVADDFVKRVCNDGNAAK